MAEKTLEEVKNKMEETEIYGAMATYKIDEEKLEGYSFKAIAKMFNDLLGPIYVDISGESMAEKMLLDSPIGPLLTKVSEKVDILPEGDYE